MTLRRVEETAVIEATRIVDGDPLQFNVVIRDGCGQTRHRVSLAQNHFGRLSGGRDPKEAILEHFDVSVLSRCFPEFERGLPVCFARGRYGCRRFANPKARDPAALPGPRAFRLAFERPSARSGPINFIDADHWRKRRQGAQRMSLLPGGAMDRAR